MIDAINVEYIGEDDWGRKCYKNVKVPDRVYKDVDGVLHTISKDGEPDCPIKNKVRICLS